MMLNDSIFYPGMFTDAQKNEIKAGPLSYLIHNYHVRAKMIPRLMGYQGSQSGRAVAHFTTIEGCFLGTIHVTDGGIYEQRIASSCWGGMHENNTRDWAESSKVNYIIANMGKDRARGKCPVYEAVNVKPLTYIGTEIFPGYVAGTYEHTSVPTPFDLKELSYIIPVARGEQPFVSIPVNIADKMDRISKYLTNTTDSQMHYESGVDEMFKRDKWIVMLRQAPAGYLLTAGAVSVDQYTRDTLKKRDYVYGLGDRLTVTQPFKLYKSISELPDDLQACMMMNYQYLKTQPKITWRPDIFAEFPLISSSTTSTVWPELNAAANKIGGNNFIYMLDTGY